MEKPRDYCNKDVDVGLGKDKCVAEIRVDFDMLPQFGKLGWLPFGSSQEFLDAGGIVLNLFYKSGNPVRNI